MPYFATADGTIIRYQDWGDGDPIVFVSAWALSASMWQYQMIEIADAGWRCVAYDRRGHGKSDAPKGPYSMERLGRDVLGVLDGLGIAKINWCGLSKGGMVGMWIGANAGDRVNKLILSNTSSYFPDKTAWEGRIKMVREKGLEGIVDANMERWFTKGFRERAPQAMEKMRKMFVATKVDGYVGCGEAIRDMDHRPLLAKITAPTLVIAGKHDPATPLEGNEFIRAHIPGAKIAVLEAAHIANMEQPKIYADTVIGFLVS